MDTCEIEKQLGQLLCSFLHIKRVIHSERERRRSTVERSAGERFDLESIFVSIKLELFALQKYTEFFFRISFSLSSYNMLKISFFHRHFQLPEVVFFQFKKLNRKTLYFCKALQFASFDTNMSLVAQKMWALINLEVAKLIHSGRPVFIRHSVIKSYRCDCTLIFLFIIGLIVMKTCGHM